jgi:sortase A
MTTALEPTPEVPVEAVDWRADDVDQVEESAWEPESVALVAVPPAPASTPLALPRPDARRLRVLVPAWIGVLLASVVLVIYAFGPFLQQRQQRTLMRAARTDISRAANEASGLEGVSTPSKAVAPGKPVGILEIGQLHLQQAVVEGVGATQTRSGPGHVPGTAGLGQPGNSAVVGRRTAFGGPFAGLGGLKHGDPILVTTDLGQSVYRVTSVGHVNLHGSKIDKVFGPSKDDRLTLVTSGSRLPSNGSSAVVVVAKLAGVAFAPTPQGGRLNSDIGTRGDPGAGAPAILALLIYGLVMAGCVMLYRRLQPRTAYLLTIGPVLAITIITAETLSRVIPAWV